MTVLGDPGKPGFSFQAYDGSGYPNQMVEKLTAPAKIKLITLGAWVGGWNASPHCILGVWDGVSNALLGSTAEFVVANKGAAANGNVDQHEHDLVTPVIIANGATFYVGAARLRTDAVQWSTGSNAITRYEATGAYPSDALGGIVAAVSVTRRIGAYVANYQNAASAWVRRSGIWVQATSFQVQRSGVWVDAESVQVDRSGVWTDAQ